MSDLTVYLHDHLAGSNFAVGLLEFLRDQRAGEPLSDALAALLSEIEQDRQVLQGLIDRAGNGVPILKEATAWMGEKLSEFKLRSGSFGTFEALEALALGIQGKLALWEAMTAIANGDVRLAGVDFNQLIERAQLQHAVAEDLRLQAAREAFALAPQ
jgi:hypothetical protein